jgi:hypothetical protein
LFLLNKQKEKISGVGILEVVKGKKKIRKDIVGIDRMSRQVQRSG